MKNLITIAVDAMGGDGSPLKVIKGITDHYKKNKNIFYRIFGNKDEITKCLTNDLNPECFEITHTDEKVEEDTALVEMVSYSIERSIVRGSVGSTWETAKDVCYDWKFDPRKIETKNIVIWHALDDDLCPSEIGEWLSNHFKKKGANVNFKNDNIGYGHMTYCNSYYQKTENSIVNALLNMHLKK